MTPGDLELVRVQVHNPDSGRLQINESRVPTRLSASLII